MNIIEIKNLTAERRGIPVFEDINWTLKPNENWAIIGKTGAGKTSFIDLIMGKMTVKKGEITYPFLHSKAIQEKGYFRLAEYVAVVRFNISLINYKQFYYQQRYYSSENEEVQTVRDFLKTSDEKIFNLLKINDLLDLNLNKLSNGQTRKMYLTKALLRKPNLLILDNPFLGLDVEARHILQGIINELITEGYQIIVICNYPHDIPSSIKKTLFIDNFKISEIQDSRFQIPDFKFQTRNTDLSRLPSEGVNCNKILFPTPPNSTFENAIKMDNVVVEYEEKAVLKNINWQVKQGEKWVLSGENGSGKSTLLSLIFGDHPQAYSNEVAVFDRKRGNGDSIWDIKSRIGFVSPELHLYFTGSISNFMLVTDGVADRSDFARSLFDFYGISELKKQDFQHTSTGEQRLILLLKALAQNPELLILDEPFQGMDKEVIEKTKQLINDFSKNRTLIIVTHYKEEIPSCVNQFLYLKDGQTIESNTNY
jgi:molybdate transport system ATP-binding protein